MRIVIAGAGEVGMHLTKMLSSENHELVIIDNDLDRLKVAGSTYDVMTIEGNANSISHLRESKISKADLFIGVTFSEDVNINAAILSKKLGAHKTISRIDNQEYLLPANQEIFNNLGVDYMIYPEKIAAREIVGLLSQTGSTEVVEFSGGKLQMYVIRLDENAPIINKSLRELSQNEIALEYRAVAITRDGQTIIPSGDDRFSVGDLVYVISSPAGIKGLYKYSGKKQFEVRNIMILGGSRIGRKTAQNLGAQHYVKLIEKDRQRSYKLSNMLNNTLVINGDGTNLELLKQEGLDKMDAFVAVTGNSETNILSCLLAKHLGVKRTIAEVENIDYIHLAENIGVDTIINKKLITASRIFRFTMTDEVSSIKCLTGTDAEVMEFIVKPDSPSTKGAIKEIHFPKGAIIGGVIRGKNAFIAHGETEIKPYDRVVVFALPGEIRTIGRFFN
ncbi:MAG: Trk system potassium transporter TrkA [Bacteroidales bacterium]|nr:Trk system potassium transporter TrkA [Bacteroidales bacterium]MBN2699503.1 Trk system potassium transporter TrkA [Bacteroidales bacterium]